MLSSIVSLAYSDWLHFHLGYLEFEDLCVKKASQLSQTHLRQGRWFSVVFAVIVVALLISFWQQAKA